MTAEFFGLGAILMLIGIIFLIFPRQIERSIQDVFATILGGTRSYVQMPARAAGAVFLIAGGLVIAYALLGGLPPK